MWKEFASALTLLAMVPGGLGNQKESQKSPKSPSHNPALTEEDKEILKHRDLLDNLELLQNLEKIKFLDFFGEKKEAKNQEKSGPKTTVRDNANKNK